MFRRRCPAVNATAGPHPRRCDQRRGDHVFHLSDQGFDQLIWTESIPVEALWPRVLKQYSNQETPPTI